MNSQENMLPEGTLLLGKTYRVEKQLASGGFGNTYEVTKVYFNETYAMKEFFMKGVNLRQGREVTVSVPDNRATFESQREKFKKEALRLREIHSPYIVKVHDMFEENGTVYYVMDYIDGKPLTRENTPLSEGKALDVVRQVLQALKVIHSQKPQMLHLDIKPSNLMMDGQGRVFLIDFGSSKLLDANSGITVSSGITLSKNYAPSELEDGKKERIGVWTDLYELGATLYNLLTCKQPPSPSEIVDDGAAAFSFPVTVSKATRELITWMMTPNRHHRPQTVEEVERRLNDQASEPLDEETSFGSPKANNQQDSEETTFHKQGANKPENKKPTVAGKTMSYKWLMAVGALAMMCLLAWMIWPTEGQEKGALEEVDTVTLSSEVEEDSIVEFASDLDEEVRPSSPVIIQNLVSNMVHVEGGTFTMGATEEQGRDACDDEKPAHQVTLSSFSIGKYEVTQEEWQAVMGSNPSSFKGAKRPVEQVSWTDCQEFIRKLNAMTGKRFRLPTEAEWEYAARGGNRSIGYKYAGSNDLGSVAWYNENSGNLTHDVGQKAPNELGLYDMNGNVWEWCSDWGGAYSGNSQTNPTGPSSGSSRVIRGGSWGRGAWFFRSSYRDGLAPSDRGSGHGLRLAL